MLLEWIESRRARCASAAARRLGYAFELAALSARHRRCEREWAPHLCETQSALLDAAYPLADPNGTVIVIGGGITEDLSLSDLAACFGQVQLIDIAFSHTARRQIRRWRGRIKARTIDTTGIVERIASTSLPIPINEIPRTFPFELPATLRFVASVNCLMQLPLLPARWLLGRGATETDTEAFAQALIQAHLAQLASTGAPYCLITEAEDRRYGPRGKLLEQTDYRTLLQPWLDAQGAIRQRSWQWLVHPRGELANGIWETRTVEAWCGPGGARSGG